MLPPLPPGDHILRFGETGDSLTYYVTVTAPPTGPATILAQPADVMVKVSSNATFTVLASGQAPLVYQWQFNGTNLAKETNATLLLTNAQIAQSGGYAVVITNIFGAVTSMVASLEVLINPPVIITQPTNVIVKVSPTATFTVIADGLAPLFYQWQFNGANLAKETNAALLLANVGAAQAGGYTVVITNIFGAVTSMVASLTFFVPPIIVSAPRARTNLVGTTATFTVAVTNTATLPIFYRWRKNGAGFLTNVLYERTATLVLTNVHASDAGGYSVMITNAASTGVSSSLAALTVVTATAPPLVTLTSPAGARFTPPASISLSAEASDPDGLIDRVEFYSGDTFLGTAFTGSPYLFSWNNVAAGSYTLTAHAFDNFEAMTVSDPLNITVELPPNISGIALSGGGVAITFPTSAGHDYQLETAPEVTGPWIATGDPVAGDGSPKIINSLVTGDAHRFFRVARNN